MPEKEDERSPVGIPSLGYEKMAEFWPLIHALLGGTARMREARQEWLPRESAENSTTYDARLGRSILYNGYRDTINKLKNRPFTHSITLTDIPSEIAYLEDDVDGSGKPLEIFIKEVLESLIKHGVAHIFVDHSIVEGVVEGKEMTKADEKELGVRVYLTNIAAPDLIGWQAEKTSKTIELTQIRIKSTVVQPSGDYGDEEVGFINVHTKTNWEEHIQDSEDKEKYLLKNSGVHTFEKIPLVTIYANKIGFMIAEPPLMDLAWLNLAHWQSYSDQRHILRFSRFGLIFAKGMDKKTAEIGTLEVGPSKCFLTTNNDADMKYVEHSGKSIEAGRKDIEDIETKMRVLGNQPLIKNVPDTATGERIDESRTVSQLQSWIRSLERGIIQALKFACEWRKITPLETMDVQIYSDFEAVVLGGTDKELLLKMRQSGDITGETFLKEEKRRGVFSQDMDPEIEAKLAADEAGNELEGMLPEEPEEDLDLDEEE